MSFFNPLDHVMGHNRPPTFWQKTKDTFEFFFGFPFETDPPIVKDKPFHAGVFDYLTLGIPTILLLFQLHLIPKVNNIFAKIGLWASVAIITVPILIVRALFAGALTLASLLFIGIAQCLDGPKKISSADVEAAVQKKVEESVEQIAAVNAEVIAAKAQELLQEKVKELEGANLKKKINTFIISDLQGKPTVEKVLTKADTTLKDIEKAEDKQSKKTASHHRLRFFKSGVREPVVNIKLKLEKPDHKEVYDAVYTLKVGNIKR